MARDAFLICFTGTEKPVERVKELWPEHFHITDSDYDDLPDGTAEVIIIADGRSNGILLAGDVYEKLTEGLEGEPSRFLVLPVTTGFAGYHRRSLWEWLQKVTG